jgi:hypothetical protein
MVWFKLGLFIESVAWREGGLELSVSLTFCIQENSHL